MDLYRFRGVDGDLLEILANSHAEARDGIMRARWGDEYDHTLNCGPPYSGWGLNLVEIVPDYKGKVEPIARR